MSDDLLQRIQQLQFSDRSAAEALLIGFVRDTFPQLDAVGVELRPQAVSLNSFNGFLALADETRLFFKTHTESDNVIGEYYRAGVLADAGYPVIQPKYRSTEAGKHLLIYEVIEDPSVFDVAWSIESDSADLLTGLSNAQNQADDDLFGLYKATLAPQDATDAADAPIHQLFHFRLAKGRMERFYGVAPSGEITRDVQITLPNTPELVSFEQVLNARWQINGRDYSETLAEVIQRALDMLQPEQGGPSIIGHGDAHNGNVFWLRSDDPLRILYFDPAFAGRHHPLLDLTKPLFHNVFAMWMYYPQEKAAATDVTLTVDGGVWRVIHNYDLPSVRHMFLTSKAERTLLPIVKLLHERGELREDWQTYLKAALFCCPFLTMNLADQERFPPAITLLGLAYCIEMGAYHPDSVIDKLLDGIAAQL
ncbi:MAG: phosphotransferase [Chloroflexota bacterium]